MSKKGGKALPDTSASNGTQPPQPDNRVIHTIIQDRIAALPPLDSPRFWDDVVLDESYDGLATLAWIAHAFSERHDTPNFQQAVARLFDPLETLITKFVNQSVYVGSKSIDWFRAVFDDIHQDVLETLVRDLQSDRYIEYVNGFWWKIKGKVRDKTKTVVRDAGGAVGSPRRIKATEGDVSGRKTENVLTLRSNRVSLDAPSSGSAADSSSQQVLGDTVEDPEANFIEQIIRRNDVVHMLQGVPLTDYERTLIVLYDLEGQSYAEIGQFLDRDRETISRNLQNVHDRLRQFYLTGTSTTSAAGPYRKRGQRNGGD